MTTKRQTNDMPRTGAQWKRCSTYYIWSRLPETRRIHYRTRRRLGALIDHKDREAILRLPTGERLIADRWRVAIAFLDDKRIYGVEDIERIYKEEIFKEMLCIWFALLIDGKKERPFERYIGDPDNYESIRSSYGLDSESGID